MVVVRLLDLGMVPFEFRLGVTLVNVFGFGFRLGHAVVLVFSWYVELVGVRLLYFFVFGVVWLYCLCCFCFLGLVLVCMWLGVGLVCDLDLVSWVSVG